jgi:hypothetical protein
MHKSRQKEKNLSGKLTQFAAKYKESKLGPALREFPGNYLKKYASSSVGRE